MAVSYKKLWKILIDKDMNKQDLQKSADVSCVVTTELSKGETVSMDVLIKVSVATIISDMITSEPEHAKALAYRLFTIAERKGWAQEAYAYNLLVIA